MDSILRSEILKLRCSDCKNLLSVGPIRMTANGENICGRCPNVSDASRNYAYEALASKLTFPCRFEGCNENIPWAKVRRHEDICPHRPYDCLLKTCKWSGKIVHLCSHFKEVHKDLYLKGNQSFPLDCSKDLDFFMVNCSLGKTFIFEITCALGKLQFVPYYFGYIDNPEDVTVKIKLRNNDDCLSLVKEVTSISMYDRQNLNSGIPVIFDKTLSIFSSLKVACSFQIEMNYLITDDIVPMKFSKKCNCPCDKLIEFDYYLETISNDDTKIPCIHNGCDSILRKGNIYSHTAECEYRLFRCQREGCSKIKCIFKDLVDHYIKKHDATRHDSIFTWGWNIKHLKTKKVCICFDAVIAYDTIFDDHSKITYSDQEQTYTVTFDIKEIRLKKNNQFKFKVVLLHQSDISKNLIMETVQQNFDDFQLSLSLKENIFNEYVNNGGEFCCDVVILL